VRERRQLAHQHRQRLLRRTPVLRRHLARLRRFGLRGHRRPGLPVRADHRGHQGPARPGLGRLAGLLGTGRSAPAASSGKVTEQSTKAKTPKTTKKSSSESTVESTKKAAPSKPAAKTPDRGTNNASRGTSRGDYTVRKGDTLSGIAAEHGTNWRKIYAANKAVIGGDPDLIVPGQQLDL